VLFIEVALSAVTLDCEIGKELSENVLAIISDICPSFAEGAIDFP
jgi:hypothetical protein